VLFFACFSEPLEQGINVVEFVGIGVLHLQLASLEPLLLRLNSIEVLEHLFGLAVSSHVKYHVNRLFSLFLICKSERFPLDQRSNEFLLLQLFRDHLNGGFTFNRVDWQILEQNRKPRVKLLRLHLAEFKVCVFVVPNDA